MEAQRYPKDYDGLVAGDPPIFYTKLLTNGLKVEQALVATPDSWISPEKLAGVTDAAVEACDGKNGIIDDPRQCHFDPSKLACMTVVGALAGTKSNKCLSAPQIETLKKIYSGLQDPSDKTIFSGYSPGGESDPRGWSFWLTGAEPKRIEQSLMYSFVTGYFANMVFDQSRWNFRHQDLTDALAKAEEKTGRALNATDPDLTAFRDEGGKILQYHGWNDAGIPAQSSIDYYEEVADKMGGIGEVQSFYRLFMAPGMQHCGFGFGPNAVGSAVGLPPPIRDPAHDIVAALAHWVEDDTAPDQIIATLYRNNDPSKGIAAQRPWCPYPATARYSGHGDSANVASYVCLPLTK